MPDPCQWIYDDISFTTRVGWYCPGCLYSEEIDQDAGTSNKQPTRWHSIDQLQQDPDESEDHGV
jgi:hypothetical protein